MRLRVYLDTTVISAAEDTRAPDRQQRTLEFFARADDFILSASELTSQELLQTLDHDVRERLVTRLAGVAIFSITDQMHELADQYVESRYCSGGIQR